MIEKYISFLCNKYSKIGFIKLSLKAVITKHTFPAQETKVILILLTQLWKKQNIFTWIIAWILITNYFPIKDSILWNRSVSTKYKPAHHSSHFFLSLALETVTHWLSYEEVDDYVKKKKNCKQPFPSFPIPLEYNITWCNKKRLCKIKYIFAKLSSPLYTLFAMIVWHKFPVNWLVT